MAMADKRDLGKGVQSLTRALSILDALASSEEGLTLSVLARRVSLPPSSAHRLLTTLQRQRFVRFEQTSMHWLIGVGAFVVGNAFLQSRDIVAMAKPYMRRLMEESGETVNLYVLIGSDPICKAQVPSRNPMRGITRPGATLRAHRSAAGKAMLSQWSFRELSDIIDRHGMARATANTIVSLEKLEEDLARTRVRGFAVDDEEFTLGLRCVAAPIVDEHGVPQAAMSMAGPSDRMVDARLTVLGRMVGAAAKLASEDFGSPPGEMSGLTGGLYP
jgi:IclR family acetate operon transcriptional repressor